MEKSIEPYRQDSPFKNDILSFLKNSVQIHKLIIIYIMNILI